MCIAVDCHRSPYSATVVVTGGYYVIRVLWVCSATFAWNLFSVFFPPANRHQLHLLRQQSTCIRLIKCNPFKAVNVSHFFFFFFSFIWFCAHKVRRFIWFSAIGLAARFGASFAAIRIQYYKSFSISRAYAIYRARRKKKTLIGWRRRERTHGLVTMATMTPNDDVNDDDWDYLILKRNNWITSSISISWRCGIRCVVHYLLLILGTGRY